jgi:hypothetical protein
MEGRTTAAPFPGPPPTATPDAIHPNGPKGILVADIKTTSPTPAEEYEWQLNAACRDLSPDRDRWSRPGDRR